MLLEVIENRGIACSFKFNSIQKMSEHNIKDFINIGFWRIHIKIRWYISVNFAQNFK